MSRITYKGTEYSSIKELARVYGIGYQKLIYRIQMGWPEDKWMAPVDTKRLYESEKRALDAEKKIEDLEREISRLNAMLIAKC